MTKTYPITDAQFAEAKTLMARNGGTIGQDNSFEIYGVKGHFRHEGGAITITVTKKPFFATWNKIEKTLDGFFG